MRIGLITFHASYNYGSVLQAYALQTQLKSMGHDVFVIDYLSKDFDQYRLFSLYHPRQTLRVLRGLPRYVKRKRAFTRFIENRLLLTPKRYTSKNSKSLSLLQDDFDCFVCGSDQIWNLDCTQGVDEPFFLSFAGDKRRVAYAPSLAHTSFLPEYFSEDEKERIASLLKPFHSISVREEETKGLFQPLVDLPIVSAVDPTMLLNSASWRLISSEKPNDKPYLFVYLLRSCPCLLTSAEEISAALGLEVLYLADRDLPISNSVNCFGASPEEFLSLVSHAEIVLTNSFHATVFSLLFHRPFRVFSTDESSSRIEGLLSKLDIEGNISTCHNANAIPEICWDRVDAGIDSLRESSLSYLKEALS